MPGGFIKTYGIFHGVEQIGFLCYAEYTPWTNKRKKRILHSNRLVIHPDYCGFGLGIDLIDLTSMILHKQGFDIRSKFSNKAVYKAMIKRANFKFIEAKLDTLESGKGITRNTGFRQKVLSYCFAYRPGNV